MPIQDGDFILLDYVAKVKETGNVVDTTIEDVAKREGIYDSSKFYGPMLIVVGRGWIVKGVEEALKQLEPNVEVEVEVPPEKAYGERDPGKVKILSLREFRKRGYEISVGDVVEYGGLTGVVKSISGGRVVVDFNNPLAGKTLVYKLRVVKKIEDLNEKVAALASRNLGVGLGEVGVSYNSDEKSVTIKLSPSIVTKKDIQYSKVALVSNIFELFKDSVAKVVFQEVFEKAEEKPSQ
ncbi:MAG: peptidylprolyl isomerase [Sulfolobales archaeon]|nr:peptidylprolyl isomerase [Sulfolobales archaeon]MCX8199673.1 peptidylprolyl isomerase [Sulfolobales archaeon]MDW8170627.1 peptidylprolyl isomerase [Desulfurococcaceae archaeon]